jgi:hypothetical protein
VEITTVATSEIVNIGCPEDGRYAFYNSPYTAHRLSTGIDIYPAAEFGETMPSPVTGEINLVRKVRSPRGRGFKDPGYDVVTVLKSLENPLMAIKLLHIDPVVNSGDTVERGQELGRLLRSGYFGAGTSPHVHVEVRNVSDPLRVRGGYAIKRIHDIGDATLLEELIGTVMKCVPEFSIVKLEGVAACGLPADVGGASGILDGGIPYYGWLGAHFDEDPPAGEIINLIGRPIADIRTLTDNTCLANCRDFGVKVDGTKILGLSLRLSPKSGTEVKLIPYKLGELDLSEGDNVTITIE